MGRDKTLQRIQQRAYWPSLFRDVHSYCRSCPECQKVSTPRQHRVPLIPLPIMKQPFKRIAIDIVGPLPRSLKGYQYVIVICDSYMWLCHQVSWSHTLEMYRCSSSSGGANYVFFSTMGIWHEILFDQGTNFMSQLLKEIYRLMHIHPNRTKPYHPQTDGLVERFNKTFKSMLKKVASEEGQYWDTPVPYYLLTERYHKQLLVSQLLSCVWKRGSRST